MTTKRATDILDRRLAHSEELRAAISEEKAKLCIAEQISSLRRRLGLTQSQLADLAETQQPVISRLEDAEYDGYSLKMLQKIASALQANLVVRIESKTTAPHPKEMRRPFRPPVAYSRMRRQRASRQVRCYA